MEEFGKAHNYYKLALAMEVAGENIRKDLERKYEESLKKSKNGEKGN